MFGEGDGVVFVPGLSELHLCQLLAASSPVTLGVPVAAPWQGTWFNLLSDGCYKNGIMHSSSFCRQWASMQISKVATLKDDALVNFILLWLVWTQVPVDRIFEFSIIWLYPLWRQCSRHITCRMQLATIITIYCLPTHCPLHAVCTIIIPDSLLTT